MSVFAWPGPVYYSLKLNFDISANLPRVILTYWGVQKKNVLDLGVLPGFLKGLIWSAENQ